MKKAVLNLLNTTLLIFLVNAGLQAQSFLETHVVTPTLDLSSPIGGQVDEFGRSVSIDGNYMVVGTPFSDVNGNSAGAAVVYENIGGVWSEMTTLLASDGEAGDIFGRNVDISGQTIIVGATGYSVNTSTSAGAAYIYELIGGTWVESAILIAPDGDSYDYFGHSVAIDGNKVVMGAIDDDDAGFSSGSIYIFENTAGLWSQVAKKSTTDGAFFDYFGWDVSISGSTVAASAYFDDPSGSNSGSVYIFEENGGSWNQVQKLSASDGAANDQFGFNVSIDGTVLAVGSRNDDDNGSNSGSVYLYDGSGSNWVETQKVLASDGAAANFFGWSVSVYGNRLSVGAMRENTNGTWAGAVYVLEQSGSVWTEVQKILPNDGAPLDEFGYSVCTSATHVAVGAHLNDDAGANSGSAYVFENIGGTWSQNIKFIANDMIDDPSQDIMGIDVAIDGDWAIVGAYGDDDYGTYSGSAYIYQRVDHDWVFVSKLNAADGESEDNFGFSVAISGDLAVVGAYGDDDNGSLSGSAYVFQNQGGTWVQIQKLLAADGASFDNYGFSVDIDGNNAVVGSYLDDDQLSGSGSVHFYEFDGSVFQPRGKVVAPDASANQQFGYTVRVDGTTTVIGSRFDNDDGNYSGSAYVFDFTGGNWVYSTKLLAADGAAFKYFGTSVGISEGTIMIGAPGDGSISASAGAAYVYNRVGGAWTSAGKLVNPNGTAYSYLGTRLAIDGQRAMIAAYRGTGANVQSGHVMHVEDSLGTWVQRPLLYAGDGQVDDYFGGGIDLDGQSMIVGAQQNDDAGTNSGSAYFFEECIDFDLDGICDFLQTTITNDNCAGAINVPLSEWGPPVWTAGSLYGATASADACTGVADDDLWYSFVANSENDVIHAWDVTGVNDMAIEVFDGCAGLSLGCFDNYGTGLPERALLGGLLKGTTYFYRIYDVGSGPQATQDVLTQVKTFVDGGIRDNFCGQYDYELTDQIQAERDDLGELYANPAVPVSGYGFKFDQAVSGFTVTLDNPTTDGFYTELSQVPGLQYNTIYDVSARHSVTIHANGSAPGLGTPLTLWSDYGTPCQLGLANVPPETNVKDQYCAGGNDLYLQDNIQCYPVAGASQYRFTFDDGVNAFVGLSSNYNLFLSSVNGLAYGASYVVTVEAYINGVWSQPGSSCTIITAIKPENTAVISADCSQSFDYSSSDNLVCDIVPGASIYQWRFTDTGSGDVLTFNTANYSLLLTASQTPGLISSTYSVAVRAQAGGVWGDFSSECPISINNINPIMEEPFDVSLKGAVLDEAGVTISPNPTADREVLLSVSELKVNQGMLRIRIIDGKGNVVGESSVSYAGNRIDHLLHIPSALAAGVYTVRVLGPEFLSSSKLIVLE